MKDKLGIELREGDSVIWLFNGAGYTKSYIRQGIVARVGAYDVKIVCNEYAKGL